MTDNYNIYCVCQNQNNKNNKYVDRAHRHFQPIETSIEWVASAFRQSSTSTRNANQVEIYDVSTGVET